MKKISFISIYSACVVFVGCWGSYTHREEGAVAGAVLGAGAGAVVGAPGGHAGTGAAIGGLAGAATGTVVGDAQDVQEKRSPAQDVIMEKQEKIIKQQAQEIDDVKRQRFYDEEYNNYLERTNH